MRLRSSSEAEARRVFEEALARLDAPMNGVELEANAVETRRPRRSSGLGAAPTYSWSAPVAAAASSGSCSAPSASSAPSIRLPRRYPAAAGRGQGRGQWLAAGVREEEEEEEDRRALGMGGVALVSRITSCWGRFGGAT